MDDVMDKVEKILGKKPQPQPQPEPSFLNQRRTRARTVHSKEVP